MVKTVIIVLVAILFVIGAFFVLSTPTSENGKPISSPTQQPTPTSSEEQATPSATSAASPSAELKASKAVIRTSKGNIELELYQTDAPKTVANFATKAKSGFYNNLTFHRVEDWVIQGGDPKGTGSGGADMPTELNEKPFVVGSFGVARKDNIRISNDAQFFITKQNASWLNSQYTNFGIVTKGMDIVNKIEIGDKILGIAVE